MTSSLSTILFVMSLIPTVLSREYLDYSATTKYCYSCMSEDFLEHWQHLDEVYYRPMNFTNHCYKIPTNLRIGMTPCSHSLCVTVVEPRILAGQHIGNNIIRGCFSSVFKHGSAPKYQAHASDTSCTKMPAHRLLPPHLARRASNRSVEMCYCVGQLCNDYPAVPQNTGAIAGFLLSYIFAITVFR